MADRLGEVRKPILELLKENGKSLVYGFEIDSRKMLAVAQDKLRCARTTETVP